GEAQEWPSGPPALQTQEPAGHPLPILTTRPVGPPPSLRGERFGRHLFCSGNRHADLFRDGWIAQPCISATLIRHFKGNLAVRRDFLVGQDDTYIASVNHRAAEIGI